MRGETMSRGTGQPFGSWRGGAWSRWQRVAFTWRLRRFLKRKASTPRAVARSSGLLEWSEREIARLQPSWTRRFIHRQRRLARFFETLTLVTLVGATVFFALSLERFWVWGAGAQAALREEKQVVTKWQAWNTVKKPKHMSPRGAPARPEPTPLPGKDSRKPQPRLR